MKCKEEKRERKNAPLKGGRRREDGIHVGKREGGREGPLLLNFRLDKLV